MIKYAASYGRMRALKGNLLSASDFRRLLEAPSTNEIIVILGNMGYNGLLSKHESLNNHEVEHALKQDLIKSYIKIFSFLANNFIDFIKLLMQEFELANLKTILRVLTQSSPAQNAEPLILRLEKLHSLPIDRLLSVQDMEECVEIIKKTSFGEALSRAYEIYLSDQNLFSMEVALEIDYYNRLTEFLHSFNDKSLLNIIGPDIDAKCISWSLRFRHHYKFEPEKIFQYMIANRWKFSDSLFWDITTPDNIEDSVSAFSSSPYKEIPDSIDWDSSDIIGQIEMILSRDLYQKARIEFRRNPLQMGILLAYFTLKRTEIHDLITIIYGKLLDMPQEKIEEQVIAIV